MSFHVYDPLLLQIFRSILEYQPSGCLLDAEMDRMQLALRNGTLYSNTKGDIGCWCISVLEEVGFGSSHKDVIKFNRELMEDLIQRQVAKGVPRRRALLKLLLSCIGYDGSIFQNYISNIVPDNDDVLAFWNDIYQELFDFVPNQSMPPNHLLFLLART